MNGHLTEVELIERLYGAGRNPHDCAECAAKLREMDRLRRSLAAPVDTPAEFLAAQRRAIYSRLGEKPQAVLGWVPATAVAVCMAIAGLALYHGAGHVSPAGAGAGVHALPAGHSVSAAHGDASDAQLFLDVYSMEQASGPRAAAPLDQLFAEN